MTNEIDAYASSYSARLGYEATMVRLRRKQVLASLARHPHEDVLEIGCALDPLFAHYDTYGHHTVVEPARDFAKVALDLASSHPRVRVLQVTVEDIRSVLPDDTFDFVIASAFLHEVPEPAPILAAIREVCRPAGVVHINVPNARALHRLVGIEMGVLSHVFQTSELGKALYRQREFDRDSLMALLEQAGFRILRFGTFALKPLTHEQMQAGLESGLLPTSLPDAYDAATKYAPDLGAEMYVEAVPDSRQSSPHATTRGA